MRTEKIKKETGTLPYMMFPKFLMDIRINETAKLLYMVLLDRSRLSAGNATPRGRSGHPAGSIRCLPWCGAGASK